MAPLADEGTFTTSDGVTIAFTLRAAPFADAPRIVLIHSLALDRSVWDGAVDTMRNDAAILTYDCRGPKAASCLCLRGPFRFAARPAGSRARIFRVLGALRVLRGLRLFLLCGLCGLCVHHVDTIAA